MTKLIDFDQLYPGRFLKAGELQGRKATLAISDVDLEELEGEQGKKMKGTLGIQGNPKRIVLNKTNGTCIREMFGRKLDGWIGKRVTWFEGEWNGEPALRVWGSPDIDKDMDVVIQLPKRKPIKMTLHKVAVGKVVNLPNPDASVDEPDRQIGAEG